MLIALDYDFTFTADPEFFSGVVALAQERGHRVVCATMRYPHQRVEGLPDGVDVFYTSHRAKRAFLRRQGLAPDVWIDDQPHFVDQDAG